MHFGDLARHQPDDFKDLPFRSISFAEKSAHDLQQSEELKMESDRSEYVAPKFWLKKDDKFIAERPVTCVMLEDHYVTKLESEESEFLESASIQSDQQFGKMYSKVDFEM